MHQWTEGMADQVTRFTLMQVATMLAVATKLAVVMELAEMEVLSPPQLLAILEESLDADQVCALVSCSITKVCMIYRMQTFTRVKMMLKMPVWD